MVSDKPIVIFIRGLVRSEIHWGPFLTLLLEKSGSAPFEYIFLDIPGNGKKYAQITPIEPDKVIDTLRKELADRINKKKFYLVGISLGGMITLRWLEKFPEEILGAICINSSLSATSNIFDRFSPLKIFNFFSALFNSDPKKLEDLILRVTSTAYRQNPAKYSSYLSSYVKFADQHPLRKRNIIFQLLLASRIKIKGNLSRLIILNGQQDRLVSPSCSLALSQKFHAPLMTHPTAGHDLPFDEPNWIYNQILFLLEKHPSCDSEQNLIGSYDKSTSGSQIDKEVKS